MWWQKEVKIKHCHWMCQSLCVSSLMLNILQESEQFKQDIELLSKLQIKLFQHGSILLSKVLEQVQLNTNWKWKYLCFSIRFWGGSQIYWRVKMWSMHEKEMVLAMIFTSFPVFLLKYNESLIDLVQYIMPNKLFTFLNFSSIIQPQINFMTVCLK